MPTPTDERLLQLLTNAANPDARARDRLARAYSGGYDGADTLHNVYLDFGYPVKVEFSHAWNMYRRFGIARNVADLPVITTWTTLPEIVAPEAFVRELERLAKRTKLWRRIIDLDKRQRIGRYAGLFVRVRDGKAPSEPIDKLGGAGAVVQFVPLYEGQLRISKTDNNAMSERFGLPEMYEYTSSTTGNKNENIAVTFEIHHSRVIIAAEGADDGGVLGVSALEAPYNSLLDLRKIIGAGGEGFYRNAAQSVVFKLDDTSQAQGLASLLDEFNENFDEFTRDRMRKALWTPGLTPETLQSSLAAPGEFFNNALNDVAAAARIPATILIGQQTGRLASTEDGRNFLSGINSRREDDAGEMVAAVLDWLIQYGALPFAEYEIVWDDLLALSDTERLANSDKMADINVKQFNSGGAPVFTEAEIREAAGFDPDELPDAGGLPTEADNAEE